MCMQDGSGESLGEDNTALERQISALREVLAALDAAGENIAAAHVDMALQMLLSRNA